MRRIPAVHRLLADARVAVYESHLGRSEIKREVEAVLDRARASKATQSHDEIAHAIAGRLERLRAAVLARVINATGIIIHTNLGRVPLERQAIDAAAAIGCEYSNLEYDLRAGERGSRYEHLAGILSELTGAEDSLVVNNCAAAVLLVLDTFAKGREVIVARSQLVEIGGGFRIPDVLERSGATLVEVGTTNRVYVNDFERALSPRTALLLRTHPSNYRVEGFTHEPAASELVELGRRAGIPVVEDLGSGALVDLTEFGVAPERTVQEAIADGIGLVTFSGDKLLGGPQAGIAVGHCRLIGPLKNNPLLRALRVGKMTLATLASTLERYRDGSFRDLPIFRMLGATVDDLRARGRAYVDALPAAALIDSEAYLGGGANATQRIPSVAIGLAVPNATELAKRLRGGALPIIGRVSEGRFLLDLRTIAPAFDTSVITALQKVLTAQGDARTS